MLVELRAALRTGIIRGVEWGVTLAVVLGLLLVAVRDYDAVRVGAMKGAAIYDLVERQEKARQETAAKGPAAAAIPNSAGPLPAPAEAK
jgi:hypothetical protein